MYYVGSVLIFVTALIALEWVVAYHRLTGGAWRDTAAGRHMMAFMGSITTVLFVWAVGAVFTLADMDQPTWYVLVRLVVFLSVPVVLLQRRRLLGEAQKRNSGNASAQASPDE